MYIYISASCKLLSNPKKIKIIRNYNYDWRRMQEKKNASNRFSEIATIMARMSVNNKPAKTGGPQLIAKLAEVSKAGRAAVSPELTTLKHRRDLFTLLARLPRANPERDAVWKRALALLPHVGRLSNFVLPRRLRLHDADVPYVSKLLDLGCPFGDELFAKAVVNNQLKLATMFLEAGANPDWNFDNDWYVADYGYDATSVDAFCPLSFYCIEKNLNGMLQLLIRYGVMLEQDDRELNSPLTWAIGYNNEAAVNILLRAGGDPNKPLEHNEYEGFTPLTFCIEHYVPSIAAALLGAGANVNQEISGESYSDYGDPVRLGIKGKYGDTALNLAIRNNVNGAVRQFLPLTSASAIDVFPNEYYDTSTHPIHAAFGSKNWAALDLMINMPGPHKDWRLGCMLAEALGLPHAPHQNLSVLKMLVEKGADPGFYYADQPLLEHVIPPKTPFEWQALEVMASSRTLSAGDKSSALFAAAGGPNELAVVKILLKHGADPSHTDIYDEETPVEMADDFLPEVRALFAEYAKTKKRKRNSNTKNK